VNATFRALLHADIHECFVSASIIPAPPLRPGWTLHAMAHRSQGSGVIFKQSKLSLRINADKSVTRWCICCAHGPGALQQRRRDEKMGSLAVATGRVSTVDQASNAYSFGLKGARGEAGKS